MTMAGGDLVDSTVTPYRGQHFGPSDRFFCGQPIYSACPSFSPSFLSHIGVIPFRHNIGPRPQHQVNVI